MILLAYLVILFHVFHKFNGAIQYPYRFCRVLQSFAVIELDNAVFQDLESLGKGRFFKVTIESFECLFGRILKYPKVNIN